MAIHWQDGEPPKDGNEYVAQICVPVRFKHYHPTSREHKSGRIGRWQEMNEFGGWDNVAAVNSGAYPFAAWGVVE